MYATMVEGVELVSYQLKKVENVQYDQQEESHGKDVKPVIWGEFEIVPCSLLFPRDKRSKGGRVCEFQAKEYDYERV